MLSSNKFRRGVDKLRKQIFTAIAAGLALSPLLMTGVAHAATSLTFTMSDAPNPSAVGQNVGIYVSSNYFPAPTGAIPVGTMTLYDGTTEIGQSGLNHEFATGSGTVAYAAFFQVNTLTLGTHNLHATYSGDANYVETADATLTQEVDQTVSGPGANYNTDTQVVPIDYQNFYGLGHYNLPYGQIGDAIVQTDSENVPTAPGAFAPIAVPTGNVTLSIDGTPTTPATLAAIYGTGAHVLVPIPVEQLGTHSLSASYPGDTTFSNLTFNPSVSVAPTNGNYNNDVYNVVASPTATTLVASSTGNSVGLTATVAPSFLNGYTGCNQAAISGNVQFTEGNTVLATVPVSDATVTNALGTCHIGTAATTSPINLVDGNHNIVATYLGNGNFLGSTSVSEAVDITGTPISLTLPADFSVNATSPNGATVSYATPTTTGGVGAVNVSCSPQSGSVFAIGVTTVSCSASDAYGNVASGSFNVSVVGAGGQAQSLLGQVTGVGPGKSLANKVTNVIQDLGATPVNTSSACTELTGFINQVNAQTNKSIPAATATTLVQEAQQIKTVIGC